MIYSFQFIQSKKKRANIKPCGATTQGHWNAQIHAAPYHIVEDETGVGEFEVFEQAIEFAAVERTPGTVKIISCLRLLPRVVVVQELTRADQINNYKVG